MFNEPSFLYLTVKVLPCVPYNKRFNSSFENSLIGLFKSRSYSTLNAFNMANVHESSFNLPSPQVAIAPSIMLKLLSGIIKSGSNSISVPSPSHFSHFPHGELNENNLGANSSMLTPQSGQAKCSLNRISSCPTTFMTTNPSAIFKAVSIDSANLLSIPSLITSLSTTASILCLIFFSKLISSSAIS